MTRLPTISNNKLNGTNLTENITHEPLRQKTTRHNLPEMPYKSC